MEISYLSGLVTLTFDFVISKLVSANTRDLDNLRVIFALFRLPQLVLDLGAGANETDGQADRVHCIMQSFRQTAQRVII